MRFIDITADTKKKYILKRNERVCYFMLNRSGTLTFHLSAPGAEAVILALTIENSGEHALSITQQHFAKETTSRFIAKNLVGGTARVSYDGQINIAPSALGADASQECRSLLLSAEAAVNVRPTLEIKTDAVRCSHAATTSTVSDSTLFYLATRGLDPGAGRKLIVHGFAESLLAPYKKLFPTQINAIKKKIAQTLITSHI